MAPSCIPVLIGIDASRAFDPAPTGTEIYSREIVSALLAADPSMRFRLYTRSAARIPSLPPNCEVRSIPFPRIWTHLRLSAEMVANPPDVLFVPSHVVPLLHPRRTVVTVHDLGYLYFPQANSFLGRAYLDLTTRLNAGAAQTVIADSAATSQDLIKFYHVDSSKIKVVHPALRSELNQMPTIAQLDQVKVKYSLPEEYVVSVGTIHPRKNYERLVQAFMSLPGNYQLAIVGKKGWRSSQIIDSIEKLGLGERVKFLDYVPDAELPAIYAGARLCVFPSLYEGFGFPILEAQAGGAPVVCSNTSSLPEVAGEGAEYFDPLEVNAISAVMIRVLTDDVLRTQLIARGRANLGRFAWERSARDILSIIAPR